MEGGSSIHGRRLLVAVYDYPPSPSVGGTRWLTMKKYLERLGHVVTILTTNAYGDLPTDEREGVLRAPDLVASETLRRLLGRPALPRAGADVSVERAPSALLTKVVVPDIYAASWAPNAVRAMRRLIRNGRVDALVTTSPKDSTHLIGLALPRSGPAWVADFRDGWVFESTRPPLPTPLQRALDRRLEARVARRADALVAFSDVLVADFESRLGRQAFYVPNGWDPDLDQDVAATPDELPLEPVDRDAIRLVYTGTLTGAEGAPTDRTPVPLLEALETLAREERELARRIEFIIIGRRSERDEAMLARFAWLGSIRHLGYVSRATSLGIQRTADVLVLVSSNTPSSIPHKLFEYLGARRPILHIGRAGAAQRILEETNAGVTVSPDDPAALVASLRQIARSKFGHSLSLGDIGRYSYPAVAEEMADVIERALAARSQRASTSS